MIHITRSETHGKVCSAKARAFEHSVVPKGSRKSKLCELAAQDQAEKEIKEDVRNKKMKRTRATKRRKKRLKKL